MNTKVNLNIRFTVDGSWSNDKTIAINNFIKENFRLCSEVMTGIETEKILKNPSRAKKKKATKEKVKKPKEEPKQEAKPVVEAKPDISEADQKILDRVINCVKEIDYHTDGITKDSHFQNDLGFDSLDAIELVMKLEDEFEIEIYDSEAESYYDKTVGDVFKFIKEKLDAKEKGK